MRWNCCKEDIFKPGWAVVPPPALSEVCCGSADKFKVVFPKDGRDWIAEASHESLEALFNGTYWVMPVNWAEAVPYWTIVGIWEITRRLRVMRPLPTLRLGSVRTHNG